MSASCDRSIVDYYAEHNGYSCGYCKSPNTNYSHGMWAHNLTVQDYQDLIDRGWRRSGSYCYKPILQLTCCPMYTIKCSALDFKLSKSQKKKLKRFHNYLVNGRKKPSTCDGGDANESSSDVESAEDGGDDSGINEFPGLKEKAEKAQLNAINARVNSVESSLKERFSANEDVKKQIKTDETAAENPVSAGQHLEKNEVVTSTSSGSTNENSINSQEINEGDSSRPTLKKALRPGVGMDPNRPKCKKAKLLRKERKEKKIAQLGSESVDAQKTKTQPIAKSLEEFLNVPLTESPAHRLEIRLVRSQPVSNEFISTLHAALDLYQRYQMAVHNDPIEKVTESQFTRFLVNSPLKPWVPKNGPPQGYGSFHQQYWLDGQLIAVGVIDILPNCVSSVYFFYDPDFQFLVLGTYGSLREIAFCRSLHHTAPSLRYYYMGFYIHSCPKMRYKGAYSPSFLLCPEAYTWHPIEYCIPLLEKSKYSRFNKDPEARDVEQVVSVDHVSVLFHHRAMSYQHYLSLNPSCNYLEEVTQYAGLVGNKLSKQMLLLLS